MMNIKNNNPNRALATECDNCNSKDKWVLHNVRVRGMYKRLCTSCVLKLHPGSFCPTCFDLFEVTPAQHLRVDCQKCSSFTHPHCVPNVEPSHSNFADNVSKGYVCPHCSNPNASLFELLDVSDAKAIDLSGARVLMCAARIASLSMNKAVFLARSDAEKRVKESVVSRKRAREALENLMCVAVKEKLKRYKENGVGTGTRTGTGMVSDSKVKIERGEALGKVNVDEKENGVGFSSKNGVSGFGKNGLDVPRVDEKVKVEKNDNGDDKEIVATVTNVGEQSKEEKNREEEQVNKGLSSAHPAEDQGKKIEHNDSMKKEDPPKEGSNDNESISALPAENHEKEPESNHSMKENGDQ